MPITKRIAGILTITLIHAGVSWFLFLESFGVGMRNFDTGGFPTMGERILSGVVEILFWPLFAPLTHWAGKWTSTTFPGLWGYIPLFCNSLIWGTVLWFIVERIRMKKNI